MTTKNTQFWKQQSKQESVKIFGDAKVLLTEAHRYFDWCDKNPLTKVELIKYQGSYTEADVAVNRPYTHTGLAYFLGISSHYFNTTKANLRQRHENESITVVEKALLDAIELIETAIQAQQLEGATIGIFNGNIVSRLLGLVDKKDVTSKGEYLLNISVRDNDTAKDLGELANQL